MSLLRLDNVTKRFGRDALGLRLAAVPALIGGERIGPASPQTTPGNLTHSQRLSPDKESRGLSY